MTTVADNLLRVAEGIERCADIAADAVLTTSPELDRDSLRRTFEKELWLAVDEIAELSRSGAVMV